MNKNINISEYVTNWHSTKAFALVFSHFYKITGIKGSCHFDFSDIENQIQVNLLFSKEPSEAEYKQLFNIITDIEQLFINEYMINIATNYSEIKTLLFKLTEDTKQISHKHLSLLKDKKVV